MTNKKENACLSLLRWSPVLPVESAEEFDHLHKAFKDEIKPRGTIELEQVDELTCLAWDIRRFRCAKTELIKSKFPCAIRNLLRQVSKQSGHSVLSANVEADKFAYQWFADEGAKKKVRELLRYFYLDEFAIEAEAIRLSRSDVEELDRLLASLEWRFKKTLRFVAKLRGGFGRHLRDNLDRIIDGEILGIDGTPRKNHPASHD